MNEFMLELSVSSWKVNGLLTRAKAALEDAPLGVVRAVAVAGIAFSSGMFSVVSPPTSTTVEPWFQSAFAKDGPATKGELTARLAAIAESIETKISRIADTDHSDVSASRLALAERALAAIKARTSLKS